MAAVGEHFVLSHTRRLAIQLVRRVRDDLRHGVVLASTGDEQRPAGGLGVHLRLGGGIDVRERRLKERLGRRRDVVLGVERVRFLLGERISEPVAELLGRLRDGALVVKRVAENREGALQLRERQRQDAPDLRGVQRHRRRR